MLEPKGRHCCQLVVEAGRRVGQQEREECFRKETVARLWAFEAGSDGREGDAFISLIAGVSAMLPVGVSTMLSLLYCSVAAIISKSSVLRTANSPFFSSCLL